MDGTQTPAQASASDQGLIHSRGMKFPKNPDILRPRIRQLLRKDHYERKEAEAIKRMVGDGDRVLEIGGGIGYMSTLVGSKKNVAEVQTFEANPRLIPYIRQVHALNGVTNATVTNALLADGDGAPVDFFIRQNFLASSMDRDVDPDSIIAVEQVPQRNIHEVLGTLQPDVLICDIEGAEAHLLPICDFSCLRVAVVELHPQWIGQSGVQAVFDSFHRAGMTYFPKASEGKVVTFRKGW